MKLYGADSGSNERILTTHVGSLIRPPELISFHEKKLNNEPFDEAAYNASLKTPSPRSSNSKQKPALIS
jgi:hypothetical protein